MRKYIRENLKTMILVTIISCNKELKTKNNIVRACRWYMRGLKKEWCVEKVKVDNELSK